MKRITKTKYINLKNILTITIANILLNILITKTYAAVDLAQKNTFDTPVIKVLVLAIGISLIILVLFGASQQDVSSPRKIKTNNSFKEKKSDNKTNNSNTNDSRTRLDFNELSGNIKENFNNEEEKNEINENVVSNVISNADINNDDTNINKIELKSEVVNLDANEVIKEDGINFNAGENEDIINLAELEVEKVEDVEDIKNVEKEENLEPEVVEKKATKKTKTIKAKDAEKKTAKTTKKTTKKETNVEEITEDDLTNEFLKNMDKMLKK